MLEVLSILIVTVFFMTLVTLYQHSRKRPQLKKKRLPVNRNSSFSKKNELCLLEQGYVENQQMWNVVSSDNGLTWYVVEHGVWGEKKRRRLEERHPQVLTHHQAWEKLKSYVRKNGPIKLSNNRGISLLKKAGFEVRIRSSDSYFGIKPK